MRRSNAQLLAPCLAAASILAAVACGSTGRELRPPEPGAVSPTRSTPSTSASPQTEPAGEVPALSMVLTTSAFTPGGPIPAEFSCDGPSPALSWSDIPEGTTELALAVVDVDAGAFVHWLVTGIGPTAGSVPAGAVPTGGTPQLNSKGTTGWTGPCPPPGQTHTYNFVLMALREKAEVASPAEAYGQLQVSAGANTALLPGTFRRDA